MSMWHRMLSLVLAAMLLGACGGTDAREALEQRLVGKWVGDALVDGVNTSSPIAVEFF